MNNGLKVLFLLVCEASVQAHEACIDSINSLKNTQNDVIVDIIYVSSENNKPVLVSNIYVDSVKNKKYDYVFIIRDSVCIIEELLIIKVIDIFSMNVNLGVLGIKGYRTLDNKNEYENIYGGYYQLDDNSDVILRKYIQPCDTYIEVEAITGNFMVIRGNIPVRYDVTMDILAEMVSAAAMMQGYKVVVPRQGVYWCLETEKAHSVSQDKITRYNKDFNIAKYAIKHEKPLLTIAIPTYNRSKYLNKCLDAIYNQIGEYPFVEVLVSDNCSTDDTYLITNKYNKYRNFKYVCQQENIGAENNVLYLYENASGDFVMVCGDDDYYYYGTVMRIIEAIYDYPYTAAIELSWWGDSYETYSGVGIDDFVDKCAKVYTSISSVAINRSYYMELPNKNKFAHTSLNQVYVQLAILTRHNHFCYLNGANFAIGSGEASILTNETFPINKRVDFCKIFIDQYYSILKYFLGKGLTIKCMSLEKYRVANWAITRLQEIAIKREHIIYKISDDMEEIFKRHYSKELYYDKLVESLAKIREIDLINRNTVFLEHVV